MSLKDLFIAIFERKSYDLKKIDVSEKSLHDMIDYVSTTYSDVVDWFRLLSFDDIFLDELVEGNDMSLKIAAVLSKIDRAVPHLSLRAYV